MLCYEAVIRPLSADEKQRYYAETRRFAWLFGIPDPVLPPYVEARRRVAGRRDRDRVGEALSSLWMGRARPL